MPTDDRLITISTITPVYCGAKYLSKLVLEIFLVREEWKNRTMPLEIVESIFVCDSAIDNSVEVIRALQNEYPWVRLLTLSRNFGQHAATIAGISHSTGDWVFTIDEDLSHEPKYFSAFLKCAVTQGLDIVYAKPQAHVHQSFWRDRSSIQFKRMLAAITRNPNIPSFNSYRLVRGSIARAVAHVCSHETYLDMALGWFTNSIGVHIVPVSDHRSDVKQKSGYTLGRLFSHARRMIISSPAKVLRAGVILGIVANLASVVCGIYILLLKIILPNSIPVQGWTSTFLFVLFFGGLTSFLLGVILEYLTTILLHSHGKPSFFIVDRSNDEKLRKVFENDTI